MPIEAPLLFLSRVPPSSHCISFPTQSKKVRAPSYAVSSPANGSVGRQNNLRPSQDQDFPVEEVADSLDLRNSKALNRAARRKKRFLGLKKKGLTSNRSKRSALCPLCMATIFPSRMAALVTEIGCC